MVVTIYISGISGNKEVKKRQQRVLMILDSKNIKYDVIDITEPGREDDKDFMQNKATSNGGTVSDPNPRSPLPPQIFNDDEYCGDYDQFDMANEVDTLEQFLKVEVPPEPPAAESEQEKVVNGDAEKQKDDETKENSQERETGDGDTALEKEEESPVKEKTPSREATPSERVASKEPTPAKDDEEPAAEEESPAKETSPERQKSVDKEEAAPTVKESSPIKETEAESVIETEAESVKESEAESVKETELESVKETELESKKLSKENTPEKEESVNENGTVSSREHSEEKEPTEDAIESKKDNPSEALIANEQAAAAE